MGALSRLIWALGGRRAGLFGAHARKRLTQFGLFAGLALAAIAFLLALVTAALAEAIGLIPALAIMAALAVIGCIGVLIAIKAESRAHEDKLRRQSLEDRRMVQIALLTALPALRRGGALAALAGLVAMTLLPRRSKQDET